MSFNGKEKSIVLNNSKTIDTLRDTDIHYTKKVFTEIKCKLIIPEYMLDLDLTED